MLTDDNTSMMINGSGTPTIAGYRALPSLDGGAGNRYDFLGLTLYGYGSDLYD